jgi:predicted RNase H-like HicB family nuclease
MRYAIVIEKAPKNYAAYVPDLPGCIATGRTVKETKKQIQEAIAFHSEGLIEDGLRIPQPTSLVEYVLAANGKDRTRPSHFAISKSFPKKIATFSQKSLTLGR